MTGSPAAPAGNRLLDPDFIRGICIILMVYGHGVFIGTSAEIQKQIVVLIYVFHMPIFLIYSGYFFNLDKGIGKALTSLWGIALPYVIFESLYLVILAGAEAHGFQTANRLGDLTAAGFASILIFHPKGAYWFLHTLLVYQLCMIAPRLVLRAPGQTALQLMWSCLLMVLFVQVLGFAVAPVMLAFLVLGFLFQQFRIPFPHGWTAALPTVFLLLVLATIAPLDSVTVANEAVTFASPRADFPLRVLAVLAMLSVLGAVSGAVAARLPRLHHGLRYIGANSFAILVWHPLILQVMKLLRGPLLRLDASGVAFALAAVATTVAAAVCMGWASDRIGLSRWFFGKGIYRPWSPPPPPARAGA